MAKPKKVKEVAAELVSDIAMATINEDLLTTLVSDTRKNGFINITHIDLALLEANGYVEVNKANETEKGFAWRATEKGINFIMGTPTKTEKKTAVKHTFVIGAFDPNNIVLKAKSRAGRTSKYDFDALVDVNTYMFVPATEKQPKPATSLVATVNAQNLKHAVPTGEMRTVSRKPKGGTEKVSKEVPVMAFNKEFKVVAYTQDGVSGAAIVRIK
jgi:hypothetical protein